MAVKTIKKILVAEDEKPMARALELKFKNSGLEVKAVGDGEEALEEIKKGKYDLILLDLIMPKMDGFSFLEEMKKLKLSVPTIVLSNLGQEEDEHRVIDLGAKKFFVKSNTPISEIVSYVKDFLKIK